MSKDPPVPPPSHDTDGSLPEASEMGAGASSPPSENDVHATEDATLGGYLEVHGRPPAFEGADGQPYSVSIEVEKTPDLVHPFVGYLVFPRWAETGLGIVGHAETDLLLEGATRAEVIERLGDTPLLRVKELLDEAIGAAAEDPSERSPRDRRG